MRYVETLAILRRMQLQGPLATCYFAVRKMHWSFHECAKAFLDFGDAVSKIKEMQK